MPLLIFHLSLFFCNVRIAALEREKQAHVYSKRSEFRQDYTALEELESKAVSDRKNESK